MMKIIVDQSYEGTKSLDRPSTNYEQSVASVPEL